MEPEKKSNLFQVIDKLLAESAEMEAVIKPYLNSITASFNAERVSLMLLDQGKRELYIQDALGLKDDVKEKTRIQIGEGIAGWVAEQGEAIVIDDIRKDGQFRKERKEEVYKNNSFMSIPLKVKGKVYGVLNVSERKDGESFSLDELRDLEILGMQMALLVENQLLKREIQWLREKPINEVAEISHDFRIPLTCLREVLSALTKKELGPVNEQQQKFLDIASRSIKRMISTFDDLVALATNSKEKKPVFEELDLATIVLDITNDFQGKARNKDVEIKLGACNEACMVLSDKRRINEVLMNLVDNALKFTEKGKEIGIKIVQSEKTVRVEISDQGPGVTDEMKEIIFKKHETIEKSKTNPSEEGHGLGLAIAKDMVEAIGGRTGFYNNHNKSGATFYLELPRGAEKQN